jgi:hypothetical protein
MHSNRPSRTAQSCKRFAQKLEPAQVRECVADQLYVWSAAEVDKHKTATKQAAMVNSFILANWNRGKRYRGRAEIANMLLWDAGWQLQGIASVGIINCHFHELNNLCTYHGIGF